MSQRLVDRLQLAQTIENIWNDREEKKIENVKSI